jgi:type I restriction enzyme S subunit
MKDSGVEWIGEIPENWDSKKLKYLYSNTNAGEVIDKTYWNTGNEILYTCQRTQMFSNYPDFPDYKRTISGDLLLTRNATPYIFIPEERSIYSNVVQRIHIKKGVNINFLRYSLQCGVNAEMVNGDTIPSWNMQVWNNISIPFPVLQEQQKIAAFLNEKCGVIDEIISKTEQSIEEYKKLKQSVITKAVTKGIRPNRPMQDSNIEWIGEIPQDWEIKKIKYLFRLRDERNTSPLSEVNLISLYTDLGVIQHCDIEATTGNKAQTADGYKKVYNDDIVVNIILCWMGAIGRSAYDGVTSPAYDVYKPINNTNSRFYHYYFRTKGFNGECYQVGRGIMLMRWRTYSEQFKAIKVVVPPLNEQKEIADYLDEKCSDIDTLIQKKQQFLSEMVNYKKSLIYEYVTGKKEVA